MATPPNPRSGPTDTAPPAAKAGMAVKVQRRMDQQRQQHAALLQALSLQSIALVLLLGFIGYKIFLDRPEPRYFAVNNENRILELTPLNQPNQTDAAVISWATQAASEVMTFNFRDYRKRLQDSSSFFNNTGWQSFLDALQKSRLLEGVEAKQQVVTAVPSEAPVITSQGVGPANPNCAAGVYCWMLDMPILITFEAGDKKVTEKQLLKLKIVRVSPLDNPAAMGIEQWIARSE